ncbi:uncharacterized protein LOC110444904 [Mizuhopecten yessoensis]|uniref:uncharacterized protein LOC110444904 n=1 Tax=Mizuhopecten yessoensis TaxID=6573 RepID=UPI000B45EB8C|nr:uncharacterized protein LOC110444904 [Mizuhopecten yessoensis]
MEVDSRRGVAKEEVKHESNQEDFIDLISQLDKYAEVKDRKQTKQQDTDDRQSIQEDELTQNRHDRDVAAYELFSKLEEVGQQSAPQQMATQSQDTEDQEGTRTPPPSPVEKSFLSGESSVLTNLAETADEYEEIYTEEIEEIFQESDDNGKTWKTVKKITTITPSGTTERTVVMEGTKNSTALCNGDRSPRRVVQHL